MNGGSALNYLMLGFFNIVWIPSAMKLSRKIVYVLSLICVLAGDIWGGFFEGTVQYSSSLPWLVTLSGESCFLTSLMFLSHE